MLGISILFMNGSDYEDWYVLYTTTALAVICGTILFYGSIFKRRIATLVYLIISSMSTMFYGISAVVLLTLPSAFCCLGVFISSNRNNDWSHIFNCWLLKVFLFLLHFKFSQNFAMIYVSAKDNLTYILAFLLIHGHGMKLNCFHKNYQIDTVLLWNF